MFILQLAKELLNSFAKLRINVINFEPSSTA